MTIRRHSDRRARALGVSLVVLAVALACTAAALADPPGGDMPLVPAGAQRQTGSLPVATGGSSIVAGLGAATNTPTTATPVIAAPAGGIVATQKTTLSCSTERRTRTCRYRRGATVVKICVRKPASLQVCHVPRAPAAAAASASVQVAAPAPTSGWVASPLGSVVRIYYGTGCSFPARPATCSTCSGTVLTRGLILTAGHCVYSNPTDGQPDYGFTGYFDRTTYSIVPGNDEVAGQVVQPHGIWTVKQIWTTSGYASIPPSPPSIGRDWGIIEANPNAQGQYPGDVVGAAKAKWDAQIPLGSSLYLMGYPASGIFRLPAYDGGNKQYFCSGVWDHAFRVDPMFSGSHGMQFTPCPMNGGASGGPVFHYDAKDGWVVVGVNNRTVAAKAPTDPNGYGKSMVSFWLDDEFGTFWNDVVAQINAGG